MENYTREQVLDLMSRVKTECVESVESEEVAQDLEENIDIEDILQDFDDSIEV